MIYLFRKNFFLISLPLIFILLLVFSLGIIIQATYPINIIHTIISAFLFLIFLFFIHKKNCSISIKNSFLYYIFFIFGAYSYQSAIDEYNFIYDFIQNKTVTIKGIVTDKNTTIIRNKKLTAFTITLDYIQAETQIKNCNKNIIFYTKNNEAFLINDYVIFENLTIKQPKNSLFLFYQMKEHTVATIFDKKTHYIIYHRPQWSFKKWIFEQKEKIFSRLSTKMSLSTFCFFSSLFLGNRGSIKNSLEEINEKFKIWGIFHFLARSGLHLTLFVFIWEKLLILLPLPFLIRQIIISLLSFLYLVLTWTSTPFTRAFILFLFNKVCFIIGIKFHLIHYLSLTCFLFLLYSPLYLFFLDFQLTFVLTFFLSWFNQVSYQHNTIKYSPLPSNY